jgi:hypothetical protein
MKKGLLSLLLLLLLPVGGCVVFAQQYTGMTGLLHVPSAEMDTIETLRLGVHAIPAEMMPDEMRFEGEKYASSNWYISAMPLKWLEVGYSFTLMKFHKNMNKKSDEVGFYSKDRYFSLRLRPLNEGRYWPSVVIGGNDVIGQRDGDSYSFYFRNFYVAASKHIDLPFGVVGAHLAYRKWTKSYNSRWDGVVGGITLRPSIYSPLRAIAEYDGDGINIGTDCVLFRYVQLQASLMKCRYLSAGAAIRIELR